MAKNRLQEYGVNAVLVLDVMTKISARSLEEAIEKAKDMREDSFVIFLGDYNDGKFKLSGVCLLDSLPEA